MLLPSRRAVRFRPGPSEPRPIAVRSSGNRFGAWSRGGPVSRFERLQNTVMNIQRAVGDAVSLLQAKRPAVRQASHCRDRAAAHACGMTALQGTFCLLQAHMPQCVPVAPAAPALFVA